MSGTGCIAIIGGRTPMTVVHRLGFETLFVDHPDRCEPHIARLADHLLLTDYNSHLDVVLTMLRGFHAERPLATVLAMTEPGLLPAAYACEALGLTGGAVAVTRTLLDKRLMRGRLSAHPDLAAFGRRHGHPFVAKPVDGTASRGVVLVADRDDCDRAARTLQALGAVPFLMEEYLSGREVSVEALSFAGRHVVVAVTDKHKNEAFVEIGHVVPAAGDQATRAALRAMAEAPAPGQNPAPA
jgi:biotin carboxylase